MLPTLTSPDFVKRDLIVTGGILYIFSLFYPTVSDRMAGSDEESGPVNFSEDFDEDEDDSEGEPSFK